VLAVWLVALVGFSVVGRAAGTDFSTAFQLPNTPSTHASDLLEKNFPAASGDSDQIVLHARSGTVRSPAVAAAARRMLAQVAVLPHVQGVTSPYGPAGAAQISRNGTIAFATVHFDELAPVLPKTAVKRVISVAQRAGSPQLQVELGGQAIENAEAQSSSRSTGLGVIFALIVLGLAFGALFAAFLPLITALVAIGIGYDVTGLLSHAFAVASFATILGVLIGLGVGVDYALFIVTRHRRSTRSTRRGARCSSPASRSASPCSASSRWASRSSTGWRCRRPSPWRSPCCPR
jgi:RND superfamily putative drug exporter